MNKVILVLCIVLFSATQSNAQKPILPGAYQTSEYFSLLKNKRVGLFLMMNNPFGNYVVKRIIENNSPKYKMKICKLVTQNPQTFNELKNMPYGN
jgi:hypothetical protein